MNYSQDDAQTARAFASVDSEQLRDFSATALYQFSEVLQTHYVAWKVAHDD